MHSSDENFDPHVDALNGERSTRLPEEAGQPLKAFRSGVRSAIAGMILSLLLMVPSVAALVLVATALSNAGFDFPFYADKGWCWFNIVMALFGALIFFAFGAWFFWIALRLLNQTTWLCTEAVLSIQGWSQKLVRYDEILAIHEIVYRVKLPLETPYPLDSISLFRSRYIRIWRQGDTKAPTLSITRDQVPQINAFIEMLRRFADARQIPWQVLNEDPY